MIDKKYSGTFKYQNCIDTEGYSVTEPVKFDFHIRFFEFSSKLR